MKMTTQVELGKGCSTMQRRPSVATNCAPNVVNVTTNTAGGACRIALRLQVHGTLWHRGRISPVNSPQLTSACITQSIILRRTEVGDVDAGYQKLSGDQNFPNACPTNCWIWATCLSVCVNKSHICSPVDSQACALQL
eukprot:COSAG05_NODE_1471_length_4792_cov_14.769444_3_plen_138_part_00